MSYRPEGPGDRRGSRGGHSRNRAGPDARVRPRERRAAGQICTDGHGAYTSLEGEYRHNAVQHSVGTNGIESFWSTLKRAHKGVYHKISPKHLDRYVQQFAGKHNIRDADTLAQMAAVVAGLVGQRLLYRDLIAPNGLPSGARGA